MQSKSIAAALFILPFVKVEKMVVVTFTHHDRKIVSITKFVAWLNIQTRSKA